MNNTVSEMFKTDMDIALKLAKKQHWNESKFSYLKRGRPHFGVMLLLNGQIDFSFETGVVCAKKGDVIFLPKASCYEASFRIELGDTDNYLINFDVQNELTLCGYPFKILENASFEVINFFKQIVDEEYSGEGRSIRQKGLFYLLLDKIITERKLNKSASDRTLEAAKIMLQGSEDIPISQVARRCSVSESGLRKNFGEKMGISPVQYRLSVKINKAKYLLESTDMTVSAIADILNFYDAAHFCRVFQKHTGVTPRKYLEGKKL